MYPQKDATGSEVALSPLELLADPKSETWISEEVVVAFVEEFERAHQYFLCKKHVREVCDGYLKAGNHIYDLNEDDIAYEISKENHLAQKFSLLDMEDVLHPAKDFIRRFGKNDRDSYEYRDPIFYLVFRIREKGYVLDQNPRAELEKLRKLAPFFYHNSLVCRKPPVEKEARTVIVSNISSKASGKKVWRFFSSCGGIEHVEMKSGCPGQVACITFQDLISVNNAWDLNTLGNFAAEKLGQGGEPLLLQLQSKSIQDASGVGSVVKKVKDVRTMYVEAVKKYQDLYEQYKLNQLEHVAEREEESAHARDDCWDVCEWMQLEAMANGGFTVGGVNVLHDPP